MQNHIYYYSVLFVHRGWMRIFNHVTFKKNVVKKIGIQWTPRDKVVIYIFLFQCYTSCKSVYLYIVCCYMFFLLGVSAY